MINPYQSYLVRASAGSGKTYQLSRRFLHLVASGADPATILTVTFTNKAASEMRQRILKEATRLIYDEQVGRSFVAEAESYWLKDGQNCARPRSAVQTGRAILDKTQLLSITTIDALFYEWMLRLPQAGSPSTELVDTLTQKDLHRSAFEALCVWLSSRGGLPSELFDTHVEGLRSRLVELERYRSLIWLSGEMYGDRAMTPWPLPQAVETEAAVLKRCHPALVSIIGQIANVDKVAEVRAALAKQDIQALVKAQLLNKACTVSGSLIRGKKREALAAEINFVDDAILTFVNTQKKTRLNASGATQLELSVVFAHLLGELKRNRGLVDFDDLAKGAFEVMHASDGAGHRYLLAQGIRHLLIDEFQDTSRLQWHIFEPLVEELTAGEGLSEATTVFFVGDEKQSIYGFREADPTLLGHVAAKFRERLIEASMATSYRTTPIVLEFVNKAFANTRIVDFPEHVTARIEGQAFVADHGQIAISALAEPSETTTAVEAEAQHIAAMLSDALSKPDEYQVFDRDKRCFRPLRAGDCAILYRSSTFAATYEQALHKAHLPCMRAEERGFFARPEIAEMLNLFKWLAAPDDLTAFASVLRGPLIDLPESLVFEALAKTAPSQRADEGPRQGRESQIFRYAEPSPRMDALQLLARQARSGTPPHVVLFAALNELNAASVLEQAFATSEAESRLLNSNLTRFVELVCQVEGDTTGDLLSVVRKLVALADLDEIGNAPVSANAINLMTIHKAKGLEFPLVILCDLGRPFGSKDHYWLKINQGDRTKLMHMGTRAEQPFDDPDCARFEEQFALDVECESERLLYVAMTRAQHYLFITGHQVTRSQGFDATSFHQRLWNSCLAAGGQDTSWYGVAARVAKRVDRTAGFQPAIQMADGVSRPEKLADRRPFYALRATSLAAATETCAKTLFHDPSCPAVEPPPLPIGADAYGNLVHKAIENALRTGAAICGQGPVETEATAAVHMLANLWEDAINIFPEHPCVVQSKSGAMSGIIDLLVVKDKEVWIIDYKTSRLRQPTDKNLRRLAQARGYDQQLALYGKAVRGSFPDHSVRTALLFTASAKFIEI